MSSITKHFVTFFSPGTFMPEQDTKEVASWEVDEAVKMAGAIFERHGARPYAFRFYTSQRGEEDFEPSTTKRSNLYYLGGHLETLAEVEARADPKEEILLSNMRINGVAQIIVNNNSWRFAGAFGDDDILLDVTLPPLKKGTDNE